MTNPSPRLTRKMIALDKATSDEVDDYRFGSRIKTETEALQRIIRAGLDALRAKGASDAAP